MTPLEIREQVLYNIFGEGTAPASAVARATTYLKEVMREIEDMGQWWWNRRVVGGSIKVATVITDGSVRVVAGEMPELTSLVKSQTLLAIERVMVWDAGRTAVDATSATIAEIRAEGREITRAPNESPIVAKVAMRTFNPESSANVAVGEEVRYSDPGKTEYYFFGSDIINLQGTFFNHRIFAYPIPEEETLYTAEVSVRTDLEFDSDDDVDAVQNINDRIGLALVAGGTARLASALSHTDIAQRNMAEYGSQLTRMRMDNARMLSNNLMECEYNDL